MKKTGRPKRFRNDAERQKAYRTRKKWNKERSIRFDALRKLPMGRNYQYVYAGDSCVLCGLTAVWKNKEQKELAIRFHITIPIFWQGWKLTTDKWLLCPDCSNGECEHPIARDAVKKIAWGNFEEQFSRTGVQS